MKGARNTRAGTPATTGRDERNGVAPYVPAFFCRDAGSAGHGATEAAHPDKDAAGLPLTSDIRH
ncbi:hypothetical protein RYH56_005076 [Citrobacter freundii]|uniref:Uncharacterized protein n=1 Tax=Raoultella ornithinolytica TaxID=54291 RepID=A0A4D6FW52_RAOOR|nr:hypothetical protein AM394_30930 [Klebsiella oxytoca]ELM6926914.1 hypothetical protein [Citrobacter freundii]QCB65975.1 hypothetical protein [Raoultella ornithinolytica]HCB1474901.1 hypothetical protein [Citrobacter freundii]